MDRLSYIAYAAADAHHLSIGRNNSFSGATLEQIGEHIKCLDCGFHPQRGGSVAIYPFSVTRRIVIGDSTSIWDLKTGD